MKKKSKNILHVLLIIIIISIIVLTYFTGKSVFEGIVNPVTREQSIKNIELFRDEYNNFEKSNDVEHLKILSTEFGHNIPAIYVTRDGNKNIAVLIHGMGGTKESLSHIANIFLDLGYNCIIYDQRNSGENMANYSTYGIFESYDALDVLNFSKSKIDGDGKVLLYGESYGGATALITASRDDENIDYLVLDSPVADFYEIIDQIFDKVVKEENIPKGFLKFSGNLYTRLKLGFGFDKINSADWIKGKKFKSPVLIINSKADEVTPYHMGKEIYDSISGNKKELHTEKSYKHIEFAIKNPIGYKKVISDFLLKYK